MPFARISMRNIHARRAFSKDLILRDFGPQLTLRGFRLEHPDTITLTRNETETDWMFVEQPNPTGRVPAQNQELQGLVWQVKQAHDAVMNLHEQGDFQMQAGVFANRGIQAVGQLRDWLEAQGDDRAEMLGNLTGESAAIEGGWSDDAGAQWQILHGALMTMGFLREDIR